MTDTMWVGNIGIHEYIPWTIIHGKRLQGHPGIGKTVLTTSVGMTQEIDTLYLAVVYEISIIISILCLRPFNCMYIDP